MSGSATLATAALLRSRNKVARTSCRLQKAKISVEVSNKKEAFRNKDKQMLLELREACLAAGRGLGSPLLMYFSCICREQWKDEREFCVLL